MSANDEQAIKLWQEAMTFADLCNLTAQFISGDISFIPSYGGSGVDEETDPIVPQLVKLNKHGFMTVDSQPGYLDEDWGQRACVDGFALKETALKIAALTLYTDLYIGVFEPGYDGGAIIPVIIRDFQPHGWAGSAGFEEIEFYKEVCNKRAIQALSQAWYISAIDLKWGRKNHLWKELTKVFDSPSLYSIKPHPDLNPDDKDIF